MGVGGGGGKEKKKREKKKKKKKKKKKERKKERKKAFEYLTFFVFQTSVLFFTFLYFLNNAMECSCSIYFLYFEE
jgi:polyferredoxin